MNSVTPGLVHSSYGHIWRIILIANTASYSDLWCAVELAIDSQPKLAKIPDMVLKYHPSYNIAESVTVCSRQNIVSMKKIFFWQIRSYIRALIVGCKICQFIANFSTSCNLHHWKSLMIVSFTKKAFVFECLRIICTSKKIIVIIFVKLILALSSEKGNVSNYVVLSYYWAKWARAIDREASIDCDWIN